MRIYWGRIIGGILVGALIGGGLVWMVDRELAEREPAPKPAPAVTVTAAPAPAPTVTITPAPEVIVKTVEVPVEVVREVPSAGIIDLHDGSGISYGWSRANAERRLSEMLGCDADAPAAMDDWGNHVWFAYCEPALAG